jgi:hypothetical protein
MDFMIPTRRFSQFSMDFIDNWRRLKEVFS